MKTMQQVLVEAEKPKGGESFKRLTDLTQENFSKAFGFLRELDGLFIYRLYGDGWRWTMDAEERKKAEEAHALVKNMRRNFEEAWKNLIEFDRKHTSKLDTFMGYM